jgi:hypothetical protein
MVMSAIEPKQKAQEAEIVKVANAKTAKKNNRVHASDRLLDLNQEDQEVIQDKEYDKFCGGVVRKTCLWAHQKSLAGMGTGRLVRPITPDSQYAGKGRQLLDVTLGNWELVVETVKQHLLVRQQHLYQLPGSIRVIVV